MLLELLFRTPFTNSERIRLALGIKNILTLMKDEYCSNNSHIANNLKDDFFQQFSMSSTSFGMEDSFTSVKNCSQDASKQYSSSNDIDQNAYPSYGKSIICEDDRPSDIQYVNSDGASSLSSSKQPTNLVVSSSDFKSNPNFKIQSVPAGKTSRLLNYAGLFMGMTAGAISERTKRAFKADLPSSPFWLSEQNSNRLVERLSKMRGAALKLGQIFSMQDAEILPSHLSIIFDRVRNMAYAMPWIQAQENLGLAWRETFISFDEGSPVAAASIGQVHRAVIKLGDDKPLNVAVKIQYPGVRQSLSSDVSSLRTLLLFGNKLPKGLFLDRTLDVLEKELIWETDYIREAAWMNWFRNAIPHLQMVLSGISDIFPLEVPRTFATHSGSSVLTTEWIDGHSIDMLANPSYSQSIRDKIGTTILALSLWEIFSLRAMQTDPNWTNFFFDGTRLILLDFGASKYFDPVFVDGYRRLVLAAAREDFDEGYRASVDLKYLTGLESKKMVDAHLHSLMSIGLPFRDSSSDLEKKFDFSTYSKIVKTMKSSIPVMLEERLVPPPEDTYSLHRKLSGVFLLCAKLGAKIDCKSLLLKLVEQSQSDRMKNFELDPYPN